MKQKMACLLIVGFLFLLAGCSAPLQEAEVPSFVEPDRTALVAEFTISPNETYVESKQDVVWYTVKVYQENDRTILLDATSNSAFFTHRQDTIPVDTVLEKSDIQVTWTTLMGAEAGTEDNQLAVAHVCLLSDGTVISERKINFVSGVMEIVTDTVAQHQP